MQQTPNEPHDGQAGLQLPCDVNDSDTLGLA